jgi:hypothetical protein
MTRIASGSGWRAIPTELGRIKGAAFREFLLWYAARFGRARLVTAVARAQLPDLDAAADDLGVLPNVWYPAALVHGLLDALTEGFTRQELDRVAQDAANHIMDKTLRGVYRAVFNLFVTPDRYRRHVDKLWALHYDTGRPLIEVIGAGEHRIRYVDWAGHHPFVCSLNMSSAIPIYRAMRCKAVSWTRLACRSLAGDVCESRVRWEA